jgi:hypothetical protein
MYAGIEDLCLQATFFMTTLPLAVRPAQGLLDRQFQETFLFNGPLWGHFFAGGRFVVGAFTPPRFHHRAHSSAIQCRRLSPSGSLSAFRSRGCCSSGLRQVTTEVRPPPFARVG